MGKEASYGKMGLNTSVSLHTENVVVAANKFGNRANTTLENGRMAILRVRSLVDPNMDSEGDRKKT